MRTEIAQWIETDIALDCDPSSLAKTGRMARAFDQLKFPPAELAGPSDRVALAALEDLF